MKNVLITASSCYNIYLFVCIGTFPIGTDPFVFKSKKKLTIPEFVFRSVATEDFEENHN